jgi:hypothetical protein
MNDALTTVETTGFGMSGPFTIEVKEAVRTAEGWRETGKVLGFVRVLRCWGIMHVTTVAMPAALKAFGNRGEGRTFYFGEVVS